MGKVDALIIGGGMAYTFLKAQGQEIGKSLLEADKVDLAKELLAEAKAKNVSCCFRSITLSPTKFDADAASAERSAKASRFRPTRWRSISVPSR